MKTDHQEDANVQESAKRFITVSGEARQLLQATAEKYKIIPIRNLTHIIFKIGLCAVHNHGLDEAVKFATNGNPDQLDKVGQPSNEGNKS